MSTRISRNGLTGLHDAIVRTHAPADAEIVQMLAGRPRWLHEMAQGASAVDGDTPLVPRNPQGTTGHDHSGPPYGAAMLHPIFTWGGAIGGALFTRKNSVGDPWVQHVNIGGTNDPAEVTWVARPWVRPHAPVANGPYTRGYLFVLARNTSAGTVNITADVWGDDATELASDSQALSSSATTPTLLTFSLYWRLMPGRNNLHVRLGNDSVTIGSQVAALSCCITEPVSY